MEQKILIKILTVIMIFFIHFVEFAYPQTIFSPSIPSPAPVGSQSLLQFSINNLERDARTFSMQGVVTDNMNNRVASFAVMPFVVKPGVFASATANLRFTRFQIELEQARAYFNQHNILPPDEYKICYQLNDGVAGLPEVCVNITATDNQKQATKGKKPFFERALSHVNVYGGGYVENMYASRQGTATEVPRNFTRLVANPGVSMFHIPVTSNIFVTTENSPDRQPMNNFSLEFDQQMFIQNLQTEVVRRLMEANQKKLGKYGDVLGSIKDFNQLEAFVQNPEFLKEQAQGEVLGKLTQNLSANQQAWVEKLKSGQVDGAAVNELMQTNEALKNIPAGSTAYIQMLARKDSLANISQLKSSDVNELSQLSNTLGAQGFNLEKVRELEAKRNMAMKLLERYQTLKKTRDRIKAEGLEDKIKEMENFDFSTLNNPVVLREYATQFGLDRKLNKLLFGIKHISVGNIFPYMSPMMLEGLQVSGGSVEINPGILNLGLTAGRVNRPVLNLETPERTTFDRRVIAGKVGLGKSERSAFNLLFMRLWDQNNPGISDTARQNPQANFVFGSEVRVSLFKRKLYLTGNGFVSQYIRNQNAPDFEDETVKRVNREIALYPFLFPVNTSTSIDYSYDLAGTLDLGNNIFLQVNNRYIGPGYVTLGNPFLRNDLRRNEGRIEKRMLKNRFVVGGFLRNEHDNLFQFKNIKTERTSFGAQADLRLQKLPSIRFVYSPVFQTNSLGNFVLNNMIINLAHSYNAGGLQLATQLGGNLGYSRAPVEQPRYNSQSASVTQSIFLKRFNFNLTYNHTRNNVADLEESLSVVDLAASYQVSEKLLVGGAVNRSESRRLSSLLGIRADATYRINRWVDFNLRYLYNSFSNQAETVQNFNENLINCIARFQF